MDEAIKPDVFADFRNVEVPTKTKEKKDPEDIALGRLAGHDGWKVLEEYINSLQKGIRELANQVMSEGKSFEDVGKVTVVSNLACEKLEQVKERVYDSKEAITGK